MAYETSNKTGLRAGLHLLPGWINVRFPLLNFFKPWQPGKRSLDFDPDGPLDYASVIPLPSAFRKLDRSSRLSLMQDRGNQNGFANHELILNGMEALMRKDEFQTAQDRKSIFRGLVCKLEEQRA